MAYNTYRSCLIPYENKIVALRRKKPPIPYSKIAELLCEKYQVKVRTTTIIRFLQVRVKGCKPCKYAWNIEPVNANNQQITEIPLAQKAQSLQTTKPAVADKPKPKIPFISDDGEFQMEFSETYNLTRLTPEQAEARIKELEEMEKQRALTKPKPSVAVSPKERAFDFPFSETYNLHRVSDEEAAARLKKLEEKEKNR